MKKRSSIDALRKENHAIQRNQFEAEKKVAVADTSYKFARTIVPIQEEKAQRQSQLQQLEADKKIKEEELEQKKPTCSITGPSRFTKEQFLPHKFTGRIAQ